MLKSASFWAEKWELNLIDKVDIIRIFESFPNLLDQLVSCIDYYSVCKFASFLNSRKIDMTSLATTELKMHRWKFKTHKTHRSCRVKWRGQLVDRWQNLYTNGPIYNTYLARNANYCYTFIPVLKLHMSFDRRATPMLTILISSSRRQIFVWKSDLLTFLLPRYIAHFFNVQVSL